VNFFERIRDEKRFENIDTLIEQLKKDKIEISKYFEKQGFFGLQYYFRREVENVKNNFNC
jgi:hypothetical protein